MKTRADLKRELSVSVAPGAEQGFLASATSELESARALLSSLRSSRAEVRRLISIRERKRQDFKGKVPRRAAATRADAAAEVARAGAAPCHRVADVARAEGGLELRFRAEFKAALGGVGGFERAWVVAVARGQVRLWLVEVRGVDERAGVVRLGGGGAGLAQERGEVAVVDIKPYLPYCEAWAAG